MPICQKCQEPFPNRVKIDGRTRVLSSRKFCLTCSPFGGNNRRKLDSTSMGERPCVECGTVQAKHRCNTCVSRRRRQRLRERLFKLTGDICERPGCGYGGEPRFWCALDHHHRDASTKSFPLNVSSLSERPWKEIVAEAAKCVVLCSRCHRELHGGLWSLSA